jgi:hypothetical protein
MKRVGGFRRKKKKQEEPVEPPRVEHFVHVREERDVSIASSKKLDIELEVPAAPDIELR